MTIRCLLAAAAAALCLSGASPAQSNDEIVAKWLATNTGVETLRIEFLQLRELRTLKAPVRKRGVLWLDRRNDRFRWQIGSPPETVVVRKARELLIVRPKSKKYERRAAGAGNLPGMAALAGGFPRNPEEFRRKYRLRDVKKRSDSFRIVAQPLDQSSRGLATITFVVEPQKFRLQGIDLAFRDGSSQRISFSKVDVKPSLGADLFAYDLNGFSATTF